MATGITIDEVTNTLDDIQGTEKIPVSSGISEPEVVTTGNLKDYINDGMQEEISDLSTIRSGASAGATAYQKPSSGIPSTDLASAVQTSLGKADTALQSFTETDPTVPSWAKSSSKPSYNYSEISGTPTLANVATSGSYNDLSNKPTIPDAQIQSDWNQSNTSAKDYIKNKPTIPVVPSNVSAFTNDAGYITSYTETDPVFSASAAHSITSADIAVWNTRKAQSIPFGHVDSSSIATAFTATVDGISALEDGVCCYLNNTVITSAASTTTPKCWTLNINNLGAKPVYVTTAAATFSTTQFTLNYKFLFTYDSSLNNGEGGWYIGLLYNTNTTYSTITQAEIDAGTGTKARNITPKLLRDNFYTENEVDGLLADKADSADLAAVATSGSYNDLDNKPTIPTVPTTLSSFTDDLGSSPTHTHSQYLTSAPVTSVNGQTGAVSLTLGDANVIETVKVNGSALTPDANKAVDITVPSVSGKEDTTNKVTSLSSSSTDTQYPSAKCVYDLVGDIESLLAAI